MSTQAVLSANLLSAFGSKPENLRFGTSEARSIGRVTAALVPCSFGIGADWTPPERLIAVWRCPGCDQFSWGLALLDPLFERSQWIDTGMRRARSFVLDAAMVHAGHHEQTRKVLSHGYSAGFFAERFIEVDRELGWQHGVRPTMPDEKLTPG